MVEEIKKKMTNASLQEKCIALKEGRKISQEEADLVSKFTKEQSEDPKWKEYRIGRITASKAHDVIVKYNADMTVKNEISAENLCAEICGYTFLRLRANRFSGANRQSQWLVRHLIKQ